MGQRLRSVLTRHQPADRPTRGVASGVAQHLAVPQSVISRNNAFASIVDRRGVRTFRRAGPRSDRRRTRSRSPANVPASCCCSSGVSESPAASSAFTNAGSRASKPRRTDERHPRARPARRSRRSTRRAARAAARRLVMVSGAGVAAAVPGSHDVNATKPSPSRRPWRPAFPPPTTFRHAHAVAPWSEPAPALRASPARTPGRRSGGTSAHHPRRRASAARSAT